MNNKMQTIKPKYKIGQEVYKINWCNPTTWKTCEACNGATFVHIKENGKQISCPDCRGVGKHSIYLGTRWAIGSKLTIGKIQIEQFDTEYNDHEDRITYMCRETGVGTGSVYEEKDLFTSLKAAESEVNKRNKNLKNEK